MSDVVRMILKGLKEINKSDVNLLLSDINNYFISIKSTMDYFINTCMFGGVYISSTRPAKSIINRLENMGIKLKNIYFVDTVSYLSEGPILSNENISFLESPTMLEMILTKTENMLTRVKTNDKFIFFDSINALTIYNDEKILTEFIHVLVNNLSGKNAYTILLCVKGQTPGNIESLIKMVTDNVIDIRGD